MSASVMPKYGHWRLGGEPLNYLFGSTLPTFDLMPGTYKAIKWSTWLEQTLDFAVDSSSNFFSRKHRQDREEASSS
jgi:hypothetical protein